MSRTYPTGYYGKPMKARRAIFASLVDHMRSQSFDDFVMRIQQDSNHSAFRIGCFEPGEDGKLITLVTVHISTPNTHG